MFLWWSAYKEMEFRESVCQSVILCETLTLLITFKHWMLGLWYSTCYFLVTIPFREYYQFWPCDFDDFFENISFTKNFWTVSARALIFHLNISRDKNILLIMNRFDFVNLSFKIGLLFENFNLLITFQKWVIAFKYYTRIFPMIRSFCCFKRHFDLCI